MIVIKDAPDVSAYVARGILQKHTDRGGVCIDLDRAIDYRSFFAIQKNKAADALAKKTGRKIYEVTAATLHEDFAHFFPDQREYFRVNLNDPNSKLSGEAKIIEKRIQKGYFSEEAISHIRQYQEAMTYKTAFQNILTYINLPLLSEESFEGHRMVLAKPHWKVLNTGRIGAEEPNVQSLAKSQCDLITYPKDYILLRYDSGQIEPRITYSYYVLDPVIKESIMLYDDAYYGQLTYALMPEAELKAVRAGDRKLVKQEITDELKALRSDLKKIALIANYNGDISQFDPKLAKAYVERIVNNPYRKKLLKEVQQKVAAGQTVFYSAFGTPITPKGNSKYSPGSPGWEGHVERCGINNPIQATAADLMSKSVFEQDKLLNERSSGKSWIGYYKHDEGCTYLHKDDIALKDEIAGMTAYQVRDWIPIHNDLVEGVKPAHEYDYQYE